MSKLAYISRKALGVDDRLREFYEKGPIEFYKQTKIDLGIMFGPLAAGTYFNNIYIMSSCVIGPLRGVLRNLYIDRLLVG